MTFLEKYELVRKSVPVRALMIDETIDSERVEFVFQSKNCYDCFMGYLLTDSMYTTMGWGNRLVDCTFVTESEKCYKCIDCTKCYSCTYLIDCNNSTDCHFSAFLNSCTDCFGSVALTQKKYCIFNKQFTKGEYLIKVEELKKEDPEKILSQMFALKQKIPHPASQQFNSESCPYGDYIYNSKNSYWCFNSYFIENSGYNYISANLKNCWDIFWGGGNPKEYSERCYELAGFGSCYNCAFLSDANDCTNCFYGSNLKNCTDCFGCVGLTNKKYCILNNQLTKDQYEKGVRDIKIELGWEY